MNLLTILILDSWLYSNCPLCFSNALCSLTFSFLWTGSLLCISCVYSGLWGLTIQAASSLSCRHNAHGHQLCVSLASRADYHFPVASKSCPPPPLRASSTLMAPDKVDTLLKTSWAQEDLSWGMAKASAHEFQWTGHEVKDDLLSVSSLWVSTESMFSAPLRVQQIGLGWSVLAIDIAMNALEGRRRNAAFKEVQEARESSQMPHTERRPQPGTRVCWKAWAKMWDLWCHKLYWMLSMFSGPGTSPFPLPQSSVQKPGSSLLGVYNTKCSLITIETQW